MPSLRRPGPFLRFAITIAFALMASFTAVLTTPRPVAACSCAAFETLKQAATPETAIFTGTAGPRDARGVPVDVQSWFWGTGAAPVVWLAGDSFGDGDSCGVEPPPAGSSWLWVGWATGDGTFGTGLCSPAGRLDAPEGQALLAEAVKTFGAVPVAQPEPTPVPEIVANATPEATPATDARDRATVTILGALLVGSIALFGGLVLVARRSGRSEPR